MSALAQAAAEIVVLANALDGTPSHIVILDWSDHRAELEIDRDLALAMAARLTELAERLPGGPDRVTPAEYRRELWGAVKLLRRRVTVDEQLRENDG